ncbi:MAG: hypothetical protein Kow0069_20930 [Promethearchaeota archaeon]
MDSSIPKPSLFREDGQACYFSVSVVPNAKRFSVLPVNLDDDAIGVRVPAPPRKGKANKALVEGLADFLGVPRASVVLEKGTTSRRKLVRVFGLTAARVLETLANRGLIER